MFQYSMFPIKNKLLYLRDDNSFKDEYPCEIASNFDVYYNIISSREFMNYQELQGFALCNLSEIFMQLTEHVCVDVYNMINYTCDYLLNYFKPKMNALDYWAEFDADIANDTEQKLYNFYIKQYNSLKLPFYNHLIYDKKVSILKVSKFCPNFWLYVYKNLADMFWYKNNMEKGNDKFLLSRFLNAEKCSFTDSDYYLLENITNVNSVAIIANELFCVLNTQKAYELLNNTSNESYIDKINALIQSVAVSPLIYSKSIIIKELFEEAKKHVDIQGEFNLYMNYVFIQFAKTNENLSGYLSYKAMKSFYEYADTVGGYSSQAQLLKIKGLNKENFKSYVSKHPEYCSAALIKNKDVDYLFKNLKKTHDAAGYLNVYTQKKFISHIHYPAPPPPMQFDFSRDIIR